MLPSWQLVFLSSGREPRENPVSLESVSRSIVEFDVLAKAFYSSNLLKTWIKAGTWFCLMNPRIVKDVKEEMP